jgi:hypothetical protein
MNGAIAEINLRLAVVEPERSARLRSVVMASVAVGNSIPLDDALVVKAQRTVFASLICTAVTPTSTTTPS